MGTKSFSAQVKAVRTALKLSQKELVHELFVRFPTINRRENDRAKPSPPALEKIESLLRSFGDKGEALYKTYFGKEV